MINKEVRKAVHKINKKHCQWMSAKNGRNAETARVQYAKSRNKAKANQKGSLLKFTDEEKANILQKQFASVFTHESAGDIPILTSRTNSRITDLEIMVDMVKKELVCLHTNKSTGPDDTHPCL